MASVDYTDYAPWTFVQRREGPCWVSVEQRSGERDPAQFLGREHHESKSNRRAGGHMASGRERTCRLCR